MRPERLTSPENIQGRHFSEAFQNEAEDIKRAEAMQVGDYINIEPKIFEAWAGTVLEGDMETLKANKAIRVTVEGITYKFGDKRFPDVVIVSSGGVKKQVPASLFHNYNRPPYLHRSGIAVSQMPIEDMATPDQGDNGAG